jgi:hypothetical protein
MEASNDTNASMEMVTASAVLQEEEGDALRVYDSSDDSLMDEGVPNVLGFAASPNPAILMQDPLMPSPPATDAELARLLNAAAAQPRRSPVSTQDERDATNAAIAAIAGMTPTVTTNLTVSSAAVFALRDLDGSMRLRWLFTMSTTHTL